MTQETALSEEAVVPSDSDAAAELVAILDAWAAAIVSNDVDRIAAFMADDWIMVSETGVTPAAGFLSLVRSGDLIHSAMDRVGDAWVRIYGDTAVITARVTNTAHYQGQEFPADEWTTDVMVRQDDGWRCVLSHITSAAPA